MDRIRPQLRTPDSAKAPSPIRFAGALHVVRFFLPFIILTFISCTAYAQQPFSTDDADVTGKGKFHLQISNEFDVLQRSSYPALRQNTMVFEVDYGLLDGVEIGADYPFITISNSRIVPNHQFSGFGDLDFHVKYNFLKERAGSWHPALTATVNVEVPTGDATRGLGSGFKDFSLNSILQKSITDKTKIRVNGGIVFAGSTATGDVGIRTRGRVFVAGVSLVRQFTEKLDLGVEVTAAKSSSIQASHGLRQTLVGGNYQVTPRMSFDFGVVAGNFNSPRAGVLVGISLDF